MMVANIISKRLKPCWLLRSLANGPPIPNIQSLFSTDLVPGSAIGRGPDLNASGRKQHHGAKSEIGIGVTADIKHKDAGRHKPTDSDRTARVKRNRAIVPRQTGIETGPAIIKELVANRGLTRQSARWQERCKSGDVKLLLDVKRSCVAIWSRPDNPIVAELFDLAVYLLVLANRLESCEFQHVGQATGRVIELVRSKRVHQAGNRNRRQNEKHGHRNNQFHHAEAANAAATSARGCGTPEQDGYLIRTLEQGPA